jgi:hypothetical protein
MKRRDILIAKLKAEVKISKVVAEHQKKFPPKEQNAGTNPQTTQSLPPKQPP